MTPRKQLEGHAPSPESIAAFVPQKRPEAGVWELEGLPLARGHCTRTCRLGSMGSVMGVRQRRVNRREEREKVIVSEAEIIARRTRIKRAVVREEACVNGARLNI